MAKRYKKFDPRPRERKLVMVRWGDAWAKSGWEEPEYARNHTKPVLVHSVGWMIFDNKEGITLASRIDQSGMQGGHMFIPRGMIRDVTIMRQGRLIRDQ